MSSESWRDIDSRLGEIFTGFSVMTVTDLFQIASVGGKLIFP